MKRNYYKEGLELGRKIRHEKLRQWKREIPKIDEIFERDCLNFKKWFDSYQKLINFGPRQIKYIKEKEKKLIIKYTNYAKGVKGDFKVIIPAKIKIDEDFQYFFGLWCGDKIGGGRVGIGNIQKELIFYTKGYLEKIHQKPILSLMKSSKVKDLPDFGIKFDETRIVKGMPGTHVFCVFAVNGIFKSFFDYLLKNLDTFLDLLPNRNIFFAGLFDAEGNISLEDECFRWACKNKKEVEVYRKYLSNYKLFRRYDGSNLVTYNKKMFIELIFPYIKHKEKINRIKLIHLGEGHLDNRFINILNHINNNKYITNSELAKILNVKKIWSQTRFLEKFKYIKSKGYPKKLFITKRGLKEICFPSDASVVEGPLPSTGKSTRKEFQTTKTPKRFLTSLE